VDDAPLGQLDFLYMPSRDVERDLAFYTGVMGAEVVFAIEAFGTRVAQVGLTGGGPPPAAGRAPGWRCAGAGLPGGRPRDDDGRARAPWAAHEARFGIPHGPCAAFRAPGGQRLAVSEVTRPGADARLAGRHDLGPGSG
jgi:catechol 2,3-dioxygenase-like lactoylglutathione lyase family enzyme